MNFLLSFLLFITISILGSFISDLELEGGTKLTLLKALEEVLQKERESDHTRDLFCQMQPFGS